MMRLALAGCIGALATGCVFDNHAASRPARFHAGPNMRALNVPVASSAPGAATAQRSTGAPAPGRECLSAVSASFQFTMAFPFHTYLGGEAETGRLERPGSNFAGAYGIIGTEHAVRSASLGVELAAGWRGVRYELGDDDEDTLVVEPRVRAQLWFAEQWTLGGTLGAKVGGAGEWMAGVYLGVHSQAF